MSKGFLLKFTYFFAIALNSILFWYYLTLGYPMLAAYEALMVLVITVLTIQKYYLKNSQGLKS